VHLLHSHREAIPFDLAQKRLFNGVCERVSRLKLNPSEHRSL
jgi:hypothetical protein